MSRSYGDKRAASVFIAFTLTLTNVVSVEGTPSAPVPRCPTYCRCRSDRTINGSGISVDCSGQRLTEAESTVDQLDTTTTSLDLRNNQITTIKSRSFSSLANLSVLLLDDNHIGEIQPNAFHGLLKIRLLSLTGNNLTTIKSDAFAEIAGACRSGGGDTGATPPDSSCIVDLTKNRVAVVERNAFAWIQRLEIKLGEGGDVPMTIGAYSFYGARHLGRIAVVGVPLLALKPRIFTNVEDVASIEILDTKIDRIDEFAFEGLRNIDRIAFTRVEIDLVESFAFSGIQFRKRAVTSTAADSTVTTTAADGRPETVQRGPGEELNELRYKHRQERHAKSGGVVSFSGCRLETIRTDAFRDANVARIEVSMSHIGAIEHHAFQAVVGLQSLSIVSCHFAFGRLVTDTFASLRGLDRIDLVDNDFAAIEPFTFRDVVDTAHVHIRFRSSLDNVTLLTEAFAQVSDIDVLRLSGGDDDALMTSSSNGKRTRLRVDVGAFRNLVGARHVIVENFRLPIIRRHAFSGLSRVGNLTVVNCEVAAIEREAFGTSAAHAGAVEHFDVGSGNQLACDCTTGRLLRELALHFSTYVASCYATSWRDGSKTKTLIELRQGAVRSADAITCGASLRTFGSVFIVLAFVIAFSVMCYIILP